MGDMWDIGIGYRFHTGFFNVISASYICINIGMNPVWVSYRYRFDMGDLGDIGIGLNILLTVTDISVSVSVYRYRLNSS